MSHDPTTASIEASHAELARLRAENDRLSRALCAAHMEIKGLTAGGADLGARDSIEPAVPWAEVIDHIRQLRLALDEKPRELRCSYTLNPGSLLNAYIEGDLSFDETCDILGSAAFSAASAMLRGSVSPPGSSEAWTVVHGRDEDPAIRHYPVPGGWLYQVSTARAASYRPRNGVHDWSSAQWYPPMFVPDRGEPR